MMNAGPGRGSDRLIKRSRCHDFRPLVLGKQRVESLSRDSQQLSGLQLADRVERREDVKEKECLLESMQGSKLPCV